MTDRPTRRELPKPPELREPPAADPLSPEDDEARNTMMSLVDVHIGKPEDLRGARRYDTRDLLGAGGMGEVRLLHDRRIGRRVARKAMHLSLESPVARERFLREARVQGQLEHPSIVPVYDLDIDDDGNLWFTMKRVRGVTLEQVLSRLAKNDADAEVRFSTRRLLAAFATVCHAVHYAHSRGVVHRDLKPANVMLGDFGEVYVLDWGLAWMLSDPRAQGPQTDEPDAQSGHRLTARDTVVGTLAYMAPEAIAKRHEGLDARADVYSLGVILFEILTRTQLRPKAVLGDVLRAARESTRPSEHVADVPPELDALCAATLLPDPRARPSSARAVAEAVEKYLDGDRDLALRRELAVSHVEHAQELLAGLESAKDASERGDRRLSALREATKALALDADNEAGQATLVEALTMPSNEVPPEARVELQATFDRQRASGAKLGMLGLGAWLLTLPMAIVVGVRDWISVGAMAGLTVAGVLLCMAMWRRRRYGLLESATLATLVAGVVGASSCYLGPFVLVPTCGATASLIFAMYATRRERIVATTILGIGATAPFVAEWLHLVPASYDFRPDGVLAHVRGVALPALATTAGMLYVTLAFVVLAALIVGRMRDALAASEERQFLQAWTLRRLFPSARLSRAG